MPGTHKKKVLLLSLPGLNTGDVPLFPLGIGYLLSSLRQDRPVQALHYQLSEHVQTQLPDVVCNYAPDIVGLTCTTFNRGLVRETCQWLRATHPEIQIILGGVHASFMCEQVLRVYGAHYVVIGEGETTLREICNALDIRQPLNSIKGIAYLQNEQLVKTPPREPLKNLDDLPLPDYSFAGELIRKSGMGFIISSRGCPVKCNFCSTGSYWGQQVRMNSPRRVVDEMEALVATYGVKKIFFHDDTFNLGTARVREICTEIMTRRLDVQWGVSCRVHPVNQEMIDMMVAAGCRHICWGIESGSTEMLERIGKKITREQIKAAFQCCTKHLGTISVGAFTMVGNPGENAATIAESVQFINSLTMTDSPSTAVLYILPGTKLYADLLDQHPELERYWGESDKVPLYTAENSLEQLNEWSCRISRSGTIVTVPRDGHFWDKVLFGDIPQPSHPALPFIHSELNRIIPPEIKNDEFYFIIRELAREENIRTVLEIGSSAGGGSTEAFVTGLDENRFHPKLYCMEVSKPRFTALRERYCDRTFVKCYNVSSVPLSKFPSETEVAKFYYATETALNHYPLERVIGWLRQDIDYVQSSGVPSDGIQRIKRENNITHFDMVLIDGSEFTGKAELDEIYGAGIILLDDINGFKNFQNRQRLLADPRYTLLHENWKVRNGYSIFKKIDDTLPLHFFTIVLNGEPFIRHHLEQFLFLPFRWHWHIIEGVAELNHDTAWSLPNGGRISDELHNNGLSNDGTSEYLDRISRKHPERITLYRKPPGQFWDGKREMVNAPLPRINEECLLWQVDADELWVAEKLAAMRELFIASPQKTAAYFHCDYFVGPRKYVSTLNTWATYPEDWIRVWRYAPGLTWSAHEPPIILNREGRNPATMNPFSRDETLRHGITFQHFAYALESQVRFKEIYYGYKDAVYHWRRLQNSCGPVNPGEFLPWARHDALVDEWPSTRGPLLLDSLPWQEISSNIRSLLFIRTDLIGDNVLASAMLPQLHEKFPDALITVVCREEVAELYAPSPLVHRIIDFNHEKIHEDETYRELILSRIQAVHADLCLNTLFSRSPVSDLFALESGAKLCVAQAGDFLNISPAEHARNNGYYHKLLPATPLLSGELQRHKEFLASIGIVSEELEIPFWVFPEDVESVDKLFHECGFVPEKTIIFFAGSQKGIKHYEGYATALSKICQEEGFTLIALGTKQEYTTNQMTLDAIGVQSLNLCGATTLRQSGIIMSRCRLAVGAATGLAQIACAVGTQHLVLLDGTQWGRFLPYSPLTAVVSLPLECYGCNGRCRYEKAYCIAGIAPETVAVAIRTSLATPADKPRLFAQGKKEGMSRKSEPQWISADNLLNASNVTTEQCTIIYI